MSILEYYKRASVNKKEKKEREVKVVDWISIKNEYLTTEISQRKLAKKHNIRWQTLRDRAGREKWIEEKEIQQDNIGTITVQKIVEKISDNASDVKANHYNIAKKILDKVSKSLDDDKQLYAYTDKLKQIGGNEILDDYVSKFINDKRLLNVVKSFETLQKSQRQTLGIVDDDKLTRQDKLKETKHKQDMDNKKFEQDKQEYADKMAMEKEKTSNKTGLPPVLFIENSDKYLEWKKKNESSST